MTGLEAAVASGEEGNSERRRSAKRSRRPIQIGIGRRRGREGNVGGEEWGSGLGFRCPQGLVGEVGVGRSNQADWSGQLG